MAMQHPKTWNGNAIAMQDRNGRNETIIETIALQLQCDRNAIAMRSQCDQKPFKPFQCDRSAIAVRSQCDQKPFKPFQCDRSAIAVRSQTTKTIANRKNHFKSTRSQCDRSTAKNRT
jgi:hypothetical protein